MADQDLPDPSEIFRDPEFRRLSSVEKINALNRYPDFQQLSVQEKVNAISSGLEKFRPKGEPPARGFWRTIGEVATGMATDLYQRTMHPFDTAREDIGFRAREAAQAGAAFQQGRTGEAGHHMTRAALGPTGSGIAHSQLEEFRKAGRIYKAGERAEIPFTDIPIPGVPGPQAVGHAVAGATPIVGPAAAEAGEEFQRGEYRPALAHTALLLGPDIVSGGLGLAGTAMGKATRAALVDRLSPVQRARYARMEARATQAGYGGRMLTRGERTGLKSPLTRMERGSQAVLGASGPAERTYTGRAAELERQARESAAAIAPTMTPGTPEADIAASVRTEAGQTVRTMKRQADKVYTDIRQTAASKPQTIKIGTKIETRPDPANPGQTIRVKKDITRKFEAPVPLPELRAGLGDLYREFRTKFQDLTESERMANPAFRSLHEIMHDIDPETRKLRLFKNAMDLEKDLGNIRRELRTRGKYSDFLFTPSGRVAARVINKGEALVSKALDRVQPGLSKKLEGGRAIVRNYHTADDLIRVISGAPPGGNPALLEPQTFYNNITAGGDKRAGAILRLKQLAPQTSDALWRTYIEGLLHEATKDFGRIKEGAGVQLVNGFDKLGPKTKQAAFGSKLTADLNDVFHNIKDFMPSEGSPTGYRIPALAALGAAGEAMAALLGGHPFTAMGMMGKTAAMGVGLNILSRVWFAPGGAAATARLLRAARIGGAVLREASRAFEARVAVAQKEQREAQEQREREAAPPPYEAPIQPWAAPLGTAAPSPAPAAPADKKPSPTAPAEKPQRGSVEPTPAGGTRASVPQPPEGTTWEYWGLKAPAGAEAPRAAVRPAAAPARRGAFPDLTPLYQRIGQETHAPPGLLHTIAQLESSGNPNAPVGAAGEIGLMQFMPATAKALGIDPHDPEQSIRGAGIFVRHLMTKYKGQIWKVLAAYNMGEPAFDRSQKRQPGLASLPPGVGGPHGYVRRGLALLGGGRQQLAEAR